MNGSAGDTAAAVVRPSDLPTASKWIYAGVLLGVVALFAVSIVVVKNA